MGNYAIKELKFLIDSLDSNERQIENMNSIIRNLSSIVNSLSVENSELRQKISDSSPLIRNITDVMRRR